MLAALAAAFALRVVGQALVRFLDVQFLPPMSEWYSGLIPYPQLLASQCVILAAQAWISRDLWRGSGFFASRRTRAGLALRWFSVIYFTVMVLRYVLAMLYFPERRWFGGTIPIFFHWILAAYVFLLSLYHTTEAEHANPA